MPYGQDTEEDRLRLDPQMVAFLQARTQAEPPPAPPDQSQPDPQALALLGQQDAEAADYNARQDLKEGIGRSMNYFLRRPVNPDVGAPKVDDSMRRYLISRKAGHAAAPVDPLDQQIKGLRAKLMEKELTAPPKDEKPPKVPVTESNAKALLARGIDPAGMENDEAARLLGTQLVGGGGLQVRKEEIERDKTGDLRMGRFMSLGPRSPLIGATGEKAKFLDAAEASVDVANNSEKLRGLIKKFGQGRDVPEAARTQMKQLVANLRTNLKTIMQLGVIAGPDMPQFVDPQISDPTLVEANLNAFFGSLGKTDYDTQLRGLAHNFLGKTKRKMDMLDVVPEGPLLRQFAKTRADELFMSGLPASEIEKKLEAEGY